jgi:predicted enzyme related to lactoylglutathione lyase
MNKGVRLIVYPVKDAAAATAFYTKLLGIEPYAAAPYYVGFRIDGQEIGLDPHGFSKGQTGPLAYYEVDDVKAVLQSLVAAGAEIKQDATDVGGGKLIAQAKDPDGNIIGLAQSA